MRVAQCNPLAAGLSARCLPDSFTCKRVIRRGPIRYGYKDVDTRQPGGRSFDARDGIDVATLAELRRAERFALGFVSPRHRGAGLLATRAGRVAGA
jgi:hypothetical protein